MRTERQMELSRFEGMVLRHRVSTSDPAFKTFKELESKVGNMTSEQIGLIERLIEGIVIARNQVVKRQMISELEKLEL